jgi:predicted MarR family transcription regulator
MICRDVARLSVVRPAGYANCGYSASQMTYDLRHLRLHGRIQRIPRTRTYTLTADGVRVALFYIKVHARLLRPLIARPDQPPARLELRRALATIDPVITNYADNARLTAA